MSPYEWSATCYDVTADLGCGLVIEQVPKVNSLRPPSQLIVQKLFSCHPIAHPKVEQVPKSVYLVPLICLARADFRCKVDGFVPHTQNVNLGIV